MSKYLLKRPYFTKWGRFKVDPDGTEIPDYVVDECGVPSDAKLVPDDYEQTEAERKLMPHEVPKKFDMERQIAESNAGIAKEDREETLPEQDQERQAAEAGASLEAEAQEALAEQEAQRKKRTRRKAKA